MNELFSYLELMNLWKIEYMDFSFILSDESFRKYIR